MPRNSACRAKPEKMTWLAGLFYERVDDGFDFFSRIEDYEDTPAFDFFCNIDVQPGSTDNSFYHAKNDQVTEQYAVFGEVGYSPNDRWTFTAGLRWFDHTRTRDYFTQQPNGRFSSNLGTAENSTSDITKKLSVQYRASDSAMVYALFSNRSRASSRDVVRPGTCCPPIMSRISSTTTSSASRAAGSMIVSCSTSPPSRWNGTTIRSRSSIRARCSRCWSQMSAMPRLRASARSSARSYGNLSTSGSTCSCWIPKTKSDNPIVGTVAGQRLPFSPEEKGAVWLQYTFPTGICGRQFLRPLPVDLQRQLVERHR